MALFRFHRGSLEESLKTTIIVKDIIDLLKKIIKDYKSFSPFPLFYTADQLIIKISKDEVFDDRCGWYTHRVLVQGMYGKNLDCVGFLSEPFDYYMEFMSIKDAEI